jgi:hypothetical protein
MTEEERREVKSRLIELGFWGADEPGDPTTDIHDAGTLNDRLQAKLANSVFLVWEFKSAESPQKGIHRMNLGIRKGLNKNRA